MNKAMYVGTVLAIVLMATVAQAQNTTYQQFIQDLLESNINNWLHDPVVIKSIQTQNAKHSDLTQDNIQRLDKQWRAERRAKERPLINQVLANQLSAFLTDVKKNNDGLFSEIFIMDNKGLNVGQSDVTSDYWQGDEAKWTETFGKGPEALLIGDREFDDSTGKFLIQVSVSIADPDTQEAIGAATIGVNLVQLMRASLAATMSQ